MELSMGMFMGIMFIVGLVLTVFAFRIAADVKDCPANVQSAARGLLVMGVIILTIAGTYTVCGCAASKLTNSIIGSSFIVLMGALGITVTVLTSIIHNGCAESHKSTPALLSISVLITALSVITLGYKMYDGMKMSATPHESAF